MPINSAHTSPHIYPATRDVDAASRESAAGVNTDQASKGAAMLKGFAGLRVWMARPDDNRYFGQEGRIVAMGPFKAGDIVGGGICSESADCIVEWDTGGRAMEFLHKLEPIRPEGNQPRKEPYAPLDEILAWVARG